MKTTQRYIGLSGLLLITCLAVPGSQAGTISTVDTLAAKAIEPSPEAPVRGRDKAQLRDRRLQRLAMADTAAMDSMNRGFLAPEEPRRNGNTSRPSAAGQSAGDMGLELPEPGPLSAIIATITLAAFVLIRRTF